MLRYLPAQAEAQDTTNAYADVDETNIAVPPGDTALVVIKNTGAASVDVMPAHRYPVPSVGGGASASAWYESFDDPVIVAAGAEVMFDTRTVDPLAQWFKVKVRSSTTDTPTTIETWGVIDSIARMANATARALDPSAYNTDDGDTISALAAMIAKMDSGVTPAGTEADDADTLERLIDDAKTAVDAAATAVSGDAAGDVVAQAESVQADVEALKNSVDALMGAVGGSAGTLQVNVGEMLEMLGGISVTAGAEDNDVAPVSVQVYRSVVAENTPTALGPFDLVAVLTNASTGAILQTSAFTLSDGGAGSMALLDTGGTNAVYVLTTDADGLSEANLTDVSGASGVKVRVEIYLKAQGAGAVFTCGAESTSVQFD